MPAFLLCFLALPSQPISFTIYVIQYHWSCVPFPQLNDPVAAVTGCTLDNGRFELYCNKRFGDTYMKLNEMDQKQQAFQVLPSLIWSRSVVSELLLIIHAVKMGGRSVEYKR